MNQSHQQQQQQQQRRKFQKIAEKSENSENILKRRSFLRPLYCIVIVSRKKPSYRIESKKSLSLLDVLNTLTPVGEPDQKTPPPFFFEEPFSNLT